MTIEIVGLGGKCLDIQGGAKTTGTPIILWPRHGGLNQQWQLNSDRQLVSQYDPTKCLGVEGLNGNNGDRIILCDIGTGGLNKKWTLNTDGTITSDLNRNKCIDVHGGVDQNGRPIILWDRHGGVNQKWSFIESSSNTDNSAVYTADPSKTVALSDGTKIEVKLKRNPSTGSAPGLNKVTTANLPEEKNSGWTTEVKKVYLTAESTTFMNASNNNTVNIVPGAIYSFQDFIGGANNEILGNRAPIRIYTDNALKPGATGGIVVNNPSGYEILQGNSGANLNVIRNSITESTGGIRSIYQSFTSNSEAELSLKVTAGGSYSGFTASGGYTLTQYKNRLYLTIDAIKPMYTIKAERPQAGFFTSVNSVSDKVYVKEVNYGTRILANVEIVLENRDDVINFKAAYEGAFKADLGTDFISKTKNKSERVNAYVIGAPVTTTTFSKDKLDEEIRALLATCAFQHAQPISYTLGDMNGNTVATHSTTDEVTERKSIPDNLVYRLQEATIEVETGDDNKEWQSRVAMELYSANGNVLMYQPVEKSKIEFPINKATAVGLMLHPDTNANDLLLNNIKNAGGLRVRIFYYANIFPDAWKIRGVNVKLKFVDQNDIPYPAGTSSVRLDGTLAFPCANAVQTLDGFDRRVMECYINGYFTPTTSTVMKN
jgi:hypothetical protein